IVNLRFADTPASLMPEQTGFWSMLAFTKDDIMHAIELGVMLLLGLVVLLLVVRPLVRRIITPDKPIAAGGNALALPGTAAAGVPTSPTTSPSRRSPAPPAR